jgi:hypothetical protein
MLNQPKLDIEAWLEKLKAAVVAREKEDKLVSKLSGLQIEDACISDEVLARRAQDLENRYRKSVARDFADLFNFGMAFGREIKIKSDDDKTRDTFGEITVMARGVADDISFKDY